MRKRFSFYAEQWIKDWAPLTTDPDIMVRAFADWLDKMDEHGELAPEVTR